jgi:hypothetical protein
VRAQGHIIKLRRSLDPGKMKECNCRERAYPEPFGKEAGEETDLGKRFSSFPDLGFKRFWNHTREMDLR